MNGAGNAASVDRSMLCTNMGFRLPLQAMVKYIPIRPVPNHYTFSYIRDNTMQQDSIAPTPRESAMEEEDVDSTKGVSGSSCDPNSQESTLGDEHKRPLTRRFAHEVQVDRQERIDLTLSSGEITQSPKTSFTGLTPPPLPLAMLPGKKRTLDEILEDETLPLKDKMSAEIEGIRRAEAASDFPRAEGRLILISHRRKRSRTLLGSSSTSDKNRGTIAAAPPSPRPPERRSERIREQISSRNSK
ncbi:hypothetical protein F5Y16DRAFT_371518 [Xylariaceae sp. FL0255]|nr:hypothetical protein F5Y16DRAFT_371518 [Xylariaceae sp. FL0255]